MENLRNKEINLSEFELVNKNRQILGFDETFEQYKIEEEKLLLNPYNDRFAMEKSQIKELDENNRNEILFSKEVQKKIANLIFEYK